MTKSLSVISSIRLTSKDSSVTLKWNAIATPDAINTEYLTNYFNNSNAYKKWAEKSLKDRLDYNKKNVEEHDTNVY